MHCKWKSGPKLGLNSKNLGLSQDTKKLFTKYFVITGNPMYLGGK